MYKCYSIKHGVKMSCLPKGLPNSKMSLQQVIGKDKLKFKWCIRLENRPQILGLQKKKQVIPNVFNLNRAHKFHLVRDCGFLKVAAITIKKKKIL